jgi:hypothetical protein
MAYGQAVAERDAQAAGVAQDKADVVQSQLLGDAGQAGANAALAQFAGQADQQAAQVGATA